MTPTGARRMAEKVKVQISGKSTGKSHDGPTKEKSNG